MKGNKKNKSSILIACPNDNGNLVRKHVCVGKKRIVRKIAGYTVVITPVLKNETITGYVIESGDKLSMIKKPLRTKMIVQRGFGARSSRRKVQTYVRNGHKLDLLPDGIYICRGCGNYVEPTHVCTVKL